MAKLKFNDRIKLFWFKVSMKWFNFQVKFLEKFETVLRKRRFKLLKVDDSKSANFKRKLSEIHSIFLAIDDHLLINKYSRQARRHFWDEFHRHGTLRKEIFDSISDNQKFETIIKGVIKNVEV